MSVSSGSPTHGEHSVLIADHRPIFRHGLRSIVEQFGLAIAAEVTTVDELHREIHQKSLDVAIVNADMFSEQEIKRIGQLLSMHQSHGHMLLLAIYDDPVTAQRILQAGSRACIHHSSGTEELESAVRTILNGGYYLDSRLGPEMIKSSNQVSNNKLTTRELRILALIAEGLTNRQIAAQLYLSLRTIESHRSLLKKKLDLRDRSELSRFAREHYPQLRQSEICG